MKCWTTSTPPIMESHWSTTSCEFSVNKNGCLRTDKPCPRMGTQGGINCWIIIVVITNWRNLVASENVSRHSSSRTMPQWQALWVVSEPHGVPWFKLNTSNILLFTFITLNFISLCCDTDIVWFLPETGNITKTNRLSVSGMWEKEKETVSSGDKKEVGEISKLE